MGNHALVLHHQIVLLFRLLINQCVWNVDQGIR